MSRTQWAVVGGLCLFILLLFGILLFQLRVPETGPARIQPPSCLFEGAVPVRMALPVAQDLAARWESDAYLVSAEAVWNDLRRTRGCDHWTFHFYSPQAHGMAVVRVAGGAGRLIRQGLAPNPLPPLPMEDWAVDSDQALQSWWEQGGSAFIGRHLSPTVGLKIRRGAGPDGARPLWTVAGLTSESHWVVQVDGSSGDVLSFGE